MCFSTANIFSTTTLSFYLFPEGRDTCGDDPRCGTPMTSVNDSNIARIAQIIEDDPHSTVEAVAIEVGISTESAQTILTQSLGMNKILTRWVPHRLPKKNIQDRLRIAKETLKEYESVDSRRLMEIVTGDETWFIIMNHFVRLNLGVGLEKIRMGSGCPH